MFFWEETAEKCSCQRQKEITEPGLGHREMQATDTAQGREPCEKYRLESLQLQEHPYGNGLQDGSHGTNREKQYQEQCIEHDYRQRHHHQIAHNKKQGERSKIMDGERGNAYLCHR